MTVPSLHKLNAIIKRLFNEICRKCKTVRDKWVRYAQTSAMFKEPNVKQYIADVCFYDGRMDEEDKNTVKGYKISA